MLNEPGSSYDELPYGDNCFPYTHPDHLAALASLYGVEASPVDRARVLELGCAAGGNLIPLGLDAPVASFVGIDLSARQIEAGQALTHALGLRNVDLRTMDLAEVGPAFGEFDYIICHGVYSWVSAQVRSRIWEICATNLSAQGIVYISYNTYPGWHGRGMVRELLAYHARSPGAAVDRVGRARSFLEDLVNVVADKSSAYARILRNEGEFLKGVGDSYLYHEHLEESNEPIYVHEFLRDAAAAGLQFVTEARTAGLRDSLPAEARATLERWADDDAAAEQYLDFLCNRTFRRSVLCRVGVSRTRTPAAERVAGRWIRTNLMPVAAAPDTLSDRPEEFRRPESPATLTTNNPVIKSALVELNAARPGALRFEDLCARVHSRLAVDGDVLKEQLQGAMLRCALSDLVDLQTRPARFALDVEARPVASRLARLQATETDRVVNLCRRTVTLDGLDRMILGLLDGTRSRAELLQSLQKAVADDEFSVYEGDAVVSDPETIAEILRSQVDATLARLASMALLEASES